MTSESASFDSIMHETRTIEPAQWIKDGAWVNSMEQYQEMYERSVADPEGFWADMASELIYWEKPWEEVLRWEFETPQIEWFRGGKTNVAYNCLDRHLTNGRRLKAALVWESDEGRSKAYTYQSLYYKVCKFANVLKKHGVGKGDRVAIYLPMIPEIAIAMLACARIGAIHSVVFAGFSSNSLRDRIQDCGAKLLITADEGFRGGRTTPLKALADEALVETPSIETVIVVSRAQTRGSITNSGDG